MGGWGGAVRGAFHHRCHLKFSTTPLGVLIPIREKQNVSRVIGMTLAPSGYDQSKGTGRRWLVVSSSSCNDLTAVSFVLELLAHYGASAGLRALLNYFDAGPRTPCPAFYQVRNASHLVPDYVASFSFVPGFKTRLWRTLPPELTASYQYVWLRDSDVITTPRLFAPAEVEHWMHVTAATVAAPSVLPFANTKPVHGWWTPWRSSFAGTLPRPSACTDRPRWPSRCPQTPF